MTEILAGLPGKLVPWYRENRRDLPWRQDREPYHIWVSEIMLQQTRVEAVKGYYLRFLESLPTIQALAECDDDRLQKLWEGLGYYSRVRNLKKAANVIMTQYGGSFPQSYREVLSLPGIGEYTAGAICSIAFNIPVPAVDGNVLRVLARLLSDPSPIDLPEIKALRRTQLSAIYPREAGDFTQALMELGATVCGPNRKPECLLCPCHDICRAAGDGTAENLPVKSPKRARREESLTVFLLSAGEKIAIEKRPESGLLAGLWQFPNLPGTLNISQAADAVREMGLKLENVVWQREKHHIFTHIRWQMRGYYLEVAEPGGSFTWMTLPEIEANAALPTAFRQFLDGESE